MVDDPILLNICTEAIDFPLDIYNKTHKFSPYIFKNLSTYKLIRLIMMNNKLTCEDAVELCLNTNSDIFRLLRTYPEYIMKHISQNPFDKAVNILLENQHLKCPTELLNNSNPQIFGLLEANFPNFNDDQLDGLLENPLIY